MGGKPSPFGIDEEKWGDFFSRLKDLPHCDFVGVHVFSGTQCLDGKTLLDNIACILQIAKEIHRVTSLELKTVNFGGGFGVPYYEGQRPIDVDQVCAGMSGQFTQFKQETGLAHCTGVLELGRYLVAQAGAYVARIVDVKESRGKKFCVLDGGINHHLAAAGQLGKFIRENLQIINLSRADSGVTEQVSLVGPLCASLDIIGENVRIEKPEAGHYIAVLTSGAYAYTASPVLFLSHETPLELLIDGSQVSIIRQRHTTDADGV